LDLPNPVEYQLPRLMRTKLHLERQFPLSVFRCEVGSKLQADSAMNMCHTTITLMAVTVLRAIVERELVLIRTARVPSLLDTPRNFFPFAHIAGTGKVGGYFERQIDDG